MRILYITLLLIAGVALSCKKSNKLETASKIEVQKNLKPWPVNKSEAILPLNNNTVTVFLYGGASEEYIAINLSKPSKTGDVADFGAGNIRLLGGDVFIDNFELDKTKPYQLEITSFNADSKSIAGEFSFTVKRDDWFTQSLGAASNLFSGHFDLKYKEY